MLPAYARRVAALIEDGDHIEFTLKGGTIRFAIYKGGGKYQLYGADDQLVLETPYLSNIIDYLKYRL